MIAKKERHDLELMIAAKEVERQRAKTLFLRGRLSIDETEAHLDAAVAEIVRLRERVAALDAQQQLATMFQAQVGGAELLLGRFQDQLDAIEKANDRGANVNLLRCLSRIGRGERA